MTAQEVVVRILTHHGDDSFIRCNYVVYTMLAERGFEKLGGCSEYQRIRGLQRKTGADIATSDLPDSMWQW